MKAVRAIALSLVLLAPAARAQDARCADADADESRAQQLREEGRDLDAVRLLEAVVACERTPRRVGRLGLAEAAAGLWVASERHLAEAVAASDPWVRRVRRDLAAQLERVRARVGNLEVISNAPAGEVRAGGAAIATLPMREPVRVPAGALTYEVVAPGFVREVRRVEIAAGVDRLTRENVALTPEPPTSPRVAAPDTPPALPPPPSEARAPRPAQPPITLPVEPPPPRGTWMRPAAIAATTVGGALLVGGVVAVVIGSSAAARYNDDARCFVEGRGSRDAQCGDERDTAESMRGLAIGGLVGAGALIAAGVGLFVASPSSRPAPSLHVAAGPGDLGVSLGGRF